MCAQYSFGEHRYDPWCSQNAFNHCGLDLKDGHATDSPLSREAEHRMASKGNADGSRLAHRKVIRRLKEEGVYFMSFCRFCLFFTHFMEVKKCTFSRLSLRSDTRMGLFVRHGARLMIFLSALQKYLTVYSTLPLP